MDVHYWATAKAEITRASTRLVFSRALLFWDFFLTARETTFTDSREILFFLQRDSIHELDNF
jgi:hypothetical protein